MDKYFLLLIGIIFLSIIIIFYIKFLDQHGEIVSKNSNNLHMEKPYSDNDSSNYDSVSKDDPLSHLKSEDFTILE